MRAYEAVFLGTAEEEARGHLLQHFDKEKCQEDLCFALWRPSTGQSRYTAIIYKIILPNDGDIELHGNVSFHPPFVTRATELALEEGAGLAFMHSHPSDGWQYMSGPDVIAEKDFLAPLAQATKLPLLGLTLGTDGYWSARFWKKEKDVKRYWCRKVRVVGKETYGLFYNDHIAPPRGRREILKRTFDTWGEKNQNNIARMRVGIVGLGSVGGIVAEAMARIGVEEIVLIDPDKIKKHNLDRLIYGKVSDIGKLKVSVASEFIKEHATADKFNITALPLGIQNKTAYDEALDCDFLFSCVDRSVPRDVLNLIAFSHLIPVVDGGVAVGIGKEEGNFWAHWRSQLITPYHQCMLCNDIYTSTSLQLEKDRSWDSPSYVSNLPKGTRDTNENVFPFGLNTASMEVNMMIRYIVNQVSWPPGVHQQIYWFSEAYIDAVDEGCREFCEFQDKIIAMGDRRMPIHIQFSEPQPKKKFWMSWFNWLLSKRS